MVRNHAFSSGINNYRQFQRLSATKLKSVQSTHRRPMPRGEPSLQELEARRNDFFGRRPSAFGVELSTSMDEQHWERGLRGLGPRSSSEGALVRFADYAVN